MYSSTLFPPVTHGATAARVSVRLGAVPYARRYHAAKRLGFAEVADDYGKAAREMAGKWVSMAQDGDHFKLAFD